MLEKKQHRVILPKIAEENDPELDNWTRQAWVLCILEKRKEKKREGGAQNFLEREFLKELQKEDSWQGVFGLLPEDYTFPQA